jgi:hypothetical protein
MPSVRTWPAPPPPESALELRRSSRLVQADSGKYVSVVDRAALWKKLRMEGSGAPDTGRRGELPTEDLIAIAVEDGSSFPDCNVEVIAVACDISLIELNNASSSDSELLNSP